MPTSQVTVIIPNFNREKLIGETISNVLEQTLPPHEIIVIDDGSTDRSVEVIRTFGDKVKLIQQTNQGPGAARNAGLLIATGDYLQFQDSDDLYSRNKLEVQAKLLEQTGADIAFSPWVKVRIEGRSVIFEDQVLQQKMPPSRLTLPYWWLRGWSTVFQSLLFRRSFLDRVGSYRTDLRLGEDGELFFRALTDSPKIAFSNEALMLYRLHTTNKLTQDEGASPSRRVADWSRSLQRMVQRWESVGLQPDFITRSIFLAGVQKHLAYQPTAPCILDDSVSFLSRQVAQMPGPWLRALNLGLRLAERVRLLRKGSRWMPAYQAGAPTTAQLKLIEELGFQIKGRF